MRLQMIVNNSDIYKIGDVVFHLSKNNMIEYMIERINYIQNDKVLGGNYYRYLIVVKEFKYSSKLPDPYNSRCWVSEEDIQSAKLYYREEKLNSIFNI